MSSDGYFNTRLRATTWCVKRLPRVICYPCFPITDLHINLIGTPVAMEQ